METFVCVACKKSSYTKSNIAHASSGSATLSAVTIYIHNSHQRLGFMRVLQSVDRAHSHVFYAQTQREGGENGCVASGTSEFTYINFVMPCFSYWVQIVKGIMRGRVARVK